MMNTKKLNFKKAFSLAETLTVMTLIGIIVALTVPDMVKKRAIANDRIALKKAVGEYQNIVERGITENPGLVYYRPYDPAEVLPSDPEKERKQQFYSTVFGPNCENAGRFFDIETRHANDACIFSTKDGLLWYISSLYSVVALKDSGLSINDPNLKAASFTKPVSFVWNRQPDPNASLKIFAITFDIRDGRIVMLTPWRWGRNRADVDKTINFMNKN